QKELGEQVSEDDPEEISPSGHLLKGRAWHRRIARLVAYGIPRRGRRHDDVMKLSFHFAVERGLDEQASLAELDAELRRHPHVSTTRYSMGDAKFVALSLREGKHYIRALKMRLPRP